MKEDKRLTVRIGTHTTVSGALCPKSPKNTKRGEFCNDKACKLRITRECPILKTFDRLAEFEDKLENGELVSKEWHDEQILHAESEIDRLENAIKDSDERIYDLTEQANAKMERLQKEMADILLCVRYSKGGDFDLKKYKRRVVERFAEKLKKNFDGRQTCYVFSDGYTSIGGEINEEIDELLKEYEK